MKNNSKAHFIFLSVIIIFCIILWFLPTGFENPGLLSKTSREKALVLSVDNSDLQKMGIVTTGTQDLEILILSGSFKGDTTKAHNVLMGDMGLDKLFKPNDKILAVLKLNHKDKKITSARAAELYRINIEIVLLILFALFLIWFAKWTGFCALISFLFTAMAIWKILIPFFLKGYSPLLTAFGIISFTTVVIILLITGFTKKGIVALLGSVTGIGLTTIFAIIFGHFFKIPGATRDFSQILLYAGYLDLRLSDIFIAGIFISAAGAVMDVAMDIAASQNEIIKNNPDISTIRLIKCGFSVSRSVIGTMTTTLLFAYSGSYTFILMAFMAKGTPMMHIFNINYIAAEILHTLVGSFGLVLVAPVTSIIGGYVYTHEIAKKLRLK